MTFGRRENTASAVDVIDVTALWLSPTRVGKGNRKVNRRLHAIDAEIKLSKDIHRLKGKSARTVFILDACDVGSHVGAFRNPAGALGVISFSESVDWVDSAVFVLPLLLHMQSNGIFQKSKSATWDIKRLMNNFRDGAYKSLSRSLGFEVAWA